MCLAKSWLTRGGGARCKMVALNLMPGLKLISLRIPPFLGEFNFSPQLGDGGRGGGGGPLAVL